MAMAVQIAKSRMSRRVSSLALGLVLAFGLAEGGLRVAGQRPTVLLAAETDATNSDPRLGWRLPTYGGVEGSLHQVDSEGFRTGTRSLPGGRVEQDAFRIVFLGDSYTFGFTIGWEYTYPVLVEEALDGVRCINLGISGFGIDQMWLTLQHFGFARDPDLVVLAFIKDDLRRSLRNYRGKLMHAKPRFRLDGDRLVLVPVGSRADGLRERLQRNSALWDLCRRRLESLDEELGLSYRWRLNRAVLAAVAAACHERGAPLVVVHVPQPGVVEPFRTLEREGRRSGFHVLDLAEKLPEDPRALYLGHGNHMNPEGQAFIARELVAFLESRDLVP